MAHLEKFKAPSVGHMLAHYRRDEGSLGRDNVDPSRTSANWCMGWKVGKEGKAVVGQVETLQTNWATVKGRIDAVNAHAKEQGKRSTRKDAVVMADFVIAIPEDVLEGDERKFFMLTYIWLSGKVGRENMLGGWVHADEVYTSGPREGQPCRDHMHAAFTPIKDGRFNYKGMWTRADYQTMHGELGDFLERRMGYRPSVELTDEERRERVYADKAKDIDRVKAAVEEQVAPLRQEREQLRSEVDEARRELAQAVMERNVARASARQADEVAQKASVQTAQLRREMDELQGQLDRLREAVRGLLEGVAAHIDALRQTKAGERFLDALNRRRDLPLVEMAFHEAHLDARFLEDPDGVLERSSEVVLLDEGERVAQKLDEWEGR